MPKGDIILGNALYFCGFKVVFAYFQVNKIIIIQIKNRQALQHFVTISMYRIACTKATLTATFGPQWDRRSAEFGVFIQ